MSASGPSVSRGAAQPDDQGLFRAHPREILEVRSWRFDVLVEVGEPVRAPQDHDVRVVARGVRGDGTSAGLAPPEPGARRSRAATARARRVRAVRGNTVHLGGPADSGTRAPARRRPGP